MDFGKYIAHRGLHSELVPENSLTALDVYKRQGKRQGEIPQR